MEMGCLRLIGMRGNLSIDRLIQTISSLIAPSLWLPQQQNRTNRHPDCREPEFRQTGEVVVWEEESSSLV